jgi:putative transcriptional regulator
MDMISLKDKKVSLEGKVLIASPHLEDPYFSRSIIYICAHDETGTVGVIVNHRLGMLTCKDLLILKDKKNPLEGKKFPLLFGGPVNTDMLIALSLEDKTAQLEDDITIHMDIGKFFKDKIKKKITSKKFLLVKGVTAWDSQQLEEEIADNCWFVLPATPDIIFAPRGRDKWPDLMKKLGITKLYELVSYSGTS